jgi:hypothetical protein
MRTPFRHAKNGDRTSLADRPPESTGRQAGWVEPVVSGERACCCPAPAVVKVVMAASPSRPRPVDLLLCGHHYRVSRQALAAAGVVDAIAAAEPRAPALGTPAHPATP